MKKILIVITYILVINTVKLKAQVPPDATDVTNQRALTKDKDSVNVDQLNAPANPAFNMMGISNNAIERPTDLNAFGVSIKNATNNFTKLPSSYAIEISPAALFNMKNQTLDKFNDNAWFGKSFWQTLSISAGITRSNTNEEETDDENSFTKLGVGLKFSLKRPKWTDSTKVYYDEIVRLQGIVLDGYTTAVNALGQTIQDSLRNELVKVNASTDMKQDDKLAMLLQINQELAAVRASAQQRALTDMTNGNTMAILTQNIQKLKESAKKFKIERRGGFLDFTSGFVLDFPDNKFDHSLVSKAGAWLTGGYEGGTNNKLSALAIARYLFQPDKIFADESGNVSSKDVSTFDAGVRLVFSGFQGKFSFSTEGVYRSASNKEVVPESWRFVFNTEYDVGFNQKLSFSIGRNFDGTISKDGTVIAALNFIKGFGSNKKIR